MDQKFSVKIQKNVQDGEIVLNGKRRKDILVKNSTNLSYYDQVRSPRKFGTIGTSYFAEEKFRLVIKEVFTCPVCLGLMENPVLTKSCLHRFCKACLDLYIRKQGKKECPVCKTKIDSMRHTMEDSSMKQIMNTIIPDTEKFQNFEQLSFETELNSIVKAQKKRSSQMKKQTIELQDKANILPKSSIQAETIKFPTVCIIAEDINVTSKIDLIIKPEINKKEPTLFLGKKLEREDNSVNADSSSIISKSKIVSDDKVPLIELVDKVKTSKEIYFITLKYSEKALNFNSKIVVDSSDFEISSLTKYISLSPSFQSRNFQTINFFVVDSGKFHKLDKSKKLCEIIEQFALKTYDPITIQFNFYLS